MNHHESIVGSSPTDSYISTLPSSHNDFPFFPNPFSLKPYKKETGSIRHQYAFCANDIYRLAMYRNAQVSDDDICLDPIRYEKMYQRLKIAGVFDTNKERFENPDGVLPWFHQQKIDADMFAVLLQEGMISSKMFDMIVKSGALTEAHMTVIKSSEIRLHERKFTFAYAAYLSYDDKLPEDDIVRLTLAMNHNFCEPLFDGEVLSNIEWVVSGHALSPLKIATRIQEIELMTEYLAITKEELAVLHLFRAV